MCLAKITERFDPPIEEEREGWKVFSDDGSYGISFFDQGIRLEPDKWMIADNHQAGFGKNSYLTGFHVLETEEAANEYRAWDSGMDTAYYIYIKVKYRKIRIKGVQQLDGSEENLTCFVADEMFVSSEAIEEAKRQRNKRFNLTD